MKVGSIQGGLRKGRNKISESKYKYKLSNKKEFMKKWTDRKLNMEIKKGLSLLEKEILFDILDYTDNSNIINFQTLSDDYGYSPSKMSKAKKGLEENGIIRKVGKTFFLSPLLGIKEKEISQELIEIFQDTFERYNVEINFK